MPNFNPLVLRGRDGSGGIAPLVASAFQSTRPARARRVQSVADNARPDFNPLALRGRDGRSLCNAQARQISIHSPCAGETANSSKSHLQKLSILYNLLLPDFRKNGFREKKALCRRAKRTNIECDPRGNQMRTGSSRQRMHDAPAGWAGMHHDLRAPLQRRLSGALARTSWRFAHFSKNRELVAKPFSSRRIPGEF